MSNIDIQNIPFSHIACLIIDDWKKINYAAQPYVGAMIHLNHSDLSAEHNSESAKSIVLYFLSNAGSWRGETAKLVKAELKRRLRLTGYKI
jgi:hypothetical protein